MKRCLEKAGLFERFADICVQHDGGFPWVTVFKEEKSKDGFRLIDDASKLVFCVFHDYLYKDVSYIGHVVVQKSMRCPKFVTTITEDAADLHDEEEYSVWLGHENVIFVDITNSQSSLEQVRT